jgi:hypothetical protein
MARRPGRPYAKKRPLFVKLKDPVVIATPFYLVPLLFMKHWGEQIISKFLKKTNRRKRQGRSRTRRAESGIHARP